jgi:anaerobic ribonucleoside-triphosphate reductase activating protein
MRYVSQQVTFQEIPDEISLSFLISGCPLRCKGCHSADSWNPNTGNLLNLEVLESFISKYRAVITCVLFLGGEWDRNLPALLQFATAQGLKTALYTGLEDVTADLKSHLTYLKTGSWNPALGGLKSPHTNQKLMNLTTGTQINFIAQGGHHDETDRTPN